MTARNASIPAPGQAALVDLLLATIGIFVIVFALQELQRPDDLQPAPVDGVILCQGESLTAFSRGRAAQPISGAELVQDIARLWPQGGRLWVAMDEACAFDGARADLLASEDGLAEISGAATWVLEIAPLAPGAEADLLARWEADA